MGYRHWTKEEDEIVLQIYYSRKTIKACMHLLPGRSECAIAHRPITLGLPPRRKVSPPYQSWIREAIERELRDTGPLTALQLTKKLGASYGRVRRHLYDGRGTSVHVVGYSRVYERGTASPIWGIGPGEDAPKPPRLSKEELLRRQRVKRAAQSGRINPFAVAAGMVNPTSTGTGRVYSQDMTIHLHDELEEA
jgi:hypothetical protein